GRPQPEGFVLDQAPPAGTRADKGSTVNLTVSSGKPKSAVPSVVGEQSTDAVAALTEAHLKADPHTINSDKPQGQVIAQDPPGGAQVVQGTKGRNNGPAGPKPIGRPPGAGQAS